MCQPPPCRWKSVVAPSWCVAAVETLYIMFRMPERRRVLRVCVLLLVFIVYIVAVAVAVVVVVIVITPTKLFLPQSERRCVHGFVFVLYSSL